MTVESGRNAAEQRRDQTQRVTLIGAVINLLLAAAKVVVGWLAQSQALVADGIHSLSDLLSDGLVWFASHHAAQEPDHDHPYGHGRFETLATLGLGLLLALVAVGIVWDAVERLFHPEELLRPGYLALVVAGISILSKEWLYHYTIVVSRRLKSEMLRANAWHHRSDAISSIVVLVGVAGTMAGLTYLDSIAAVLVGLMILRIAWELGWPAVQELADAGLEQERLEKIRGLILAVDGVQAIHMLRTRRMGGQASVDVHVLVDPWVSVSEGHMISQRVMDRLLEEVEEVMDVTVHIDPEDDEVAAPSRGLPLRQQVERALSHCWERHPEARRQQRMLLHYLDGRVHVDLVLPLDDFRSQEESRRLEQSLQQCLDELGGFGRLRLYYALAPK
ncbi:MAG TPA: cation transporter [Sedimenticola thiotaurini]|uniref:Cation transporter n=1 Tax=Sedimenticola thiotaurini TaxID=1543721 RepID=A0A831RKL0_9GAMM|nr:cation transporter [Sedimenticola thiotaurini]